MTSACIKKMTQFTTMCIKSFIDSFIVIGLKAILNNSLNEWPLLKVFNAPVFWKLLHQANIEHCSCRGSLFLSAAFNWPDRTGYRPVRNAALLGVQRLAAAMWWVSFTPSFASWSILGVLQITSSAITEQVSHQSRICQTCQCLK